MNLVANLELALQLADIADRVSLAGFRSSDLQVSTKPDMTPVSQADQDVERLLRDHIADHRPDHAVIGEEFGASGSAEWTWIIDPIDSTITLAYIPEPQYPDDPDRPRIGLCTAKNS